MKSSYLSIGPSSFNILLTHIFPACKRANTNCRRLIYKGYQKTLEETDLWKPSPRYLTTSTMPLLEAAWQKEIAKCRRSVSSIVSLITSIFTHVELLSKFPTHTEIA